LASVLKAEASWVRLMVLTAKSAWMICPKQSRRLLCQSKKWDKVVRSPLFESQRDIIASQEFFALSHFLSSTEGVWIRDD